MEFEWDEAKAALNIRKHQIDFLDAIQVFNDPHRVESQDTRRDYGESRWRVFGQVGHVIFVVVYTERSERIRIISARKADRDERKIYQTGRD